MLKVAQQATKLMPSLQAAYAEAAKTGVGVSSEAQQVFDALSKTMPCQWKQQNIVILNEVRLVGLSTELSGAYSYFASFACAQ